MNKTALTLTSLTMTLAALLFLAEVRGTISGAEQYKELAMFWESKVGREKLRKEIVLGRFADFKQDVALLLPDKFDDSEKSIQLRNLSSVIPHVRSDEINIATSAQKLLDKGKELVKKREYKSGIETLEKLINVFPDSHHLVEAHYLIMEAYFQQERNVEVLQWVDKMVELYPENRLTGYALLRVGGIYEMDGRPEDAIRIYKTIVAVYSDKKLVSQAQVAVSELRL